MQAVALRAAKVACHKRVICDRLAVGRSRIYSVEVFVERKLVIKAMPIFIVSVLVEVLVLGIVVVVAMIIEILRIPKFRMSSKIQARQ